MPIPCECPECGEEYSIRDERAGSRFRCRVCESIVTVPGTAGGTQHPQASDRRRPKRRRQSDERSRNTALWWILGGSVLILLLSCGGLTWFVVSRVRSIAMEMAEQIERDLGETAPPAVVGAGGTSLFELAAVPLPAFPELGEPLRTFPDGTQLHYVDFGPSNPGSTDPGARMSLRIYIPPGDHLPGSLPLMLVAPAGTNLLSGCEMDADDYHDETLPYAQAGMVTIFYSLDGPFDLEAGSNAEFREAYLQFRTAGAGLVNSRNALEFALARIPAVDPDRICCAGHSSAGTLSLLLAEHEPRIAACLSYAPCSDVPARLSDVTRDPFLSAILPGLADFLQQSSPHTHVDQLTAPVFLFHAADDSNVPVSESRNFNHLLTSRGRPITYVEVPFGNHYDSMIDRGIPGGINWLRERGVIR